jgi:hypothetical protein
MGLDLVDEVEEPVLLPATITVKQMPKQVKEDKTRAELGITVTAEGTTPTGAVEIDAPGQAVQVINLDDNGQAEVRLGTFDEAGNKTITIRYTGDDEVESETTEYVLEVKGKGSKGKGRN